ncbi:MAG: acyltransferase [Flavihumibacter sp.]
MMQPTRPHIKILDGLRGIAAIAVVVFHFMEFVFPDYADSPVSHGFLAVDFFFCLSGFVIGYAYDNRVKEMGTWAFFKRRLIRLHPLVVFGGILGFVTYFCDPFGLNPFTETNSQLFLLFLATFLLIPFPVMDNRLYNLFGMNAPSWSLFWEYVANIVYALLLCRISKKLLWVLVVVSARWLIYAASVPFGLLNGWGKAGCWVGMPRVSFSFLMGLLIYRSGWKIPNKLGFPGLAVLSALLFVVPYTAFDYIYDPLLAIIYSPLLICLGIGATLKPAFEKICRFSGDISYPLYMTHYWYIWWFGDYLKACNPSVAEMAWITVAGTIGLIAFSWAVLKLVDEPIRRWLTRRDKLRSSIAQ